MSWRSEMRVVEDDAHIDCFLVCADNNSKKLLLSLAQYLLLAVVQSALDKSTHVSSHQGSAITIVKRFSYKWCVRCCSGWLQVFISHIIKLEIIYDT